MNDQPPPPPPGQPPNPYQPYGAPGPSWAPDHPQATMILVLGILGIVACQVVAPFAWVMGKRARDEIDASGGTIGGRSQVQIGYVLGIVGSVLLGLSLLVLVVYVVIIIGVVASGA